MHTNVIYIYMCISMLYIYIYKMYIHICIYIYIYIHIHPHAEPTAPRCNILESYSRASPACIEPTWRVAFNIVYYIMM